MIQSSLETVKKLLSVLIVTSTSSSIEKDWLKIKALCKTIWIEYRKKPELQVIQAQLKSLAQQNKEVGNIFNLLFQNPFEPILINAMDSDLPLENIRSLFTFGFIRSEIDKPDSRGRSPLMKAVINKKRDIAVMLIQENANPFLPNEEGDRPLNVARFYQSPEIITLLEQAEDEYRKLHSLDEHYKKCIAYINRCKVIHYESAHILGERSTVSIEYPFLKKQISTHFGGSNTEKTMKYLTDDLKNYIDNEVEPLAHKTSDPRSLQDFKNIHEAFQLSSHYINSGNKDLLTHMVARCNSKNPPQLTIIPSEWQATPRHHSIGIGIYGDLLFVTDFNDIGDKMHNLGTIVYKIDPNKQISNQDLLDLFPQSSPLSRETIQNKISHLIEPGTQGLTLDSKVSQDISNTAASRKALIAPSLFAMNFYRLPPDQRKAIFGSMKKDTSIPDVQSLINDADHRFQETTLYMHHLTLTQWINRLKKAIKNHEQIEIDLYRELLARYILEHIGSSSIKITESILKTFPPEEIQAIFNKMESLKAGSLLKLYNYARSNKISSIVNLFNSLKIELYPNPIVNAYIYYALDPFSSSEPVFLTLLSDEAIRTTLNTLNKDGVTPLHLIISYQSTVDLSLQLGLIELLLKNGANIDLPDYEGFTPLALAVQFKDKAVVEQLILKGANPFLPDIQGRKPSDLAKINHEFELAAFLERAEVEYQKHHAEEKAYKESIDYIQCCRVIRYDTGHILGVSSQVSIEYPFLKTQVQIETEGSTPLESVTLLTDEIGNYIKNKLEPETKAVEEDQKTLNDFKRIYESFKLVSDYLNDGKSEGLDRMVSNCNNRSKNTPFLSIIPSVWLNRSQKLSGATERNRGHGIGIAIYGELLFVANRGEGMEEAGIMVYKLDPKIKFTDKSLLELLPQTPEATSDMIKTSIRSLIEPGTIGIPIGVSIQKRRNCAVANRKALIEAGLFGAEFYRLPLEARNRLFEDMKNKVALNNNPDLPKVLRYSEHGFKPSTTYFRDTKITKLMHRFKEAIQNNHTTHVILYRELVAKYLLEHLGTAKQKKYRGKIPKPILELTRAEALFRELNTLENNEYEVQQLLQLMEKLKPNSTFTLLENATNNQFFNLVKLMHIKAKTYTPQFQEEPKSSITKPKTPEIPPKKPEHL